VNCPRNSSPELPKTVANLQQAGGPPIDGYAAGGRFGDATEDLEQSGFSCVVAADDAHAVPLLDLEVDVLECPEFFYLIALDDGATMDHVAGLARQVADVASDDVAQGRVALALGGVVADEVGGEG